MTTKNILNLSNVAIADLDVQGVSFDDDLVRIDSTIAANGLNREVVYQKVSGDAEYSLSVRIGHYRNPQANGGRGQTNISVKVTTFVEELDAEDARLHVDPCSMTIASTMPGMSGVPDVSDYLVLLQNAFSILVQSATAGAADTDAVDKLKFGVVDIL